MRERVIKIIYHVFKRLQKLIVRQL